MTRVAILMASHNRVESTTRFLRAVFSDVPEQCDVAVFLVDDASTDGTAVKAQAIDPRIHVIPGGGTLYWSGAMRLASSRAQSWNPDLIIWANDDLILATGSLQKTVDLHSGGKMIDCVWVGNVASVTGGQVVYGGRMQRLDNPISFELCATDDLGIEVDTLNGNFVAFDASVYYQLLGGFPAHFRHAYSDLVIGLRARGAGLVVRTLPFIAGFDERNPRTGRMFDPAVPLARRVRFALSVFGLPLRDHWEFCREVAGPWRGALLFGRSYVRVFLPKRAIAPQR